MDSFSKIEDVSKVEFTGNTVASVVSDTEHETIKPIIGKANFLF